jgi:sugar-specific transcriptional regulator TrmB
MSTSTKILPLLSTLTSCGLSPKESAVYLALLELGESTPLAISRLSRVKRPTTYVILRELAERGLITFVTRGRGVHFRALDPSVLYEVQESALTQLRSALPALSTIAEGGLSRTSSSSSDMRVFKGVSGLQQIMQDTLTSKGEILCWVDLELVTKRVFKSYWSRYLRQRVAKRLRVKAIMVADQAARSFKARDREELHESVLIPKAQFPLHGEMNIYNDKIAILSYEDPFGVIIQSRAIAEMQRSIFNLSFNLAKAAKLG